MSYEIVRITDRPELLETAARWFSEKWGIPLEEYTSSMEEAVAGDAPVPQWYLALEGERIVGGMGVITVAAFFSLLSGRRISLMQRNNSTTSNCLHPASSRRKPPSCNASTTECYVPKLVN